MTEADLRMIYEMYNAAGSVTSAGSRSTVNLLLREVWRLRKALDRVAVGRMPGASYEPRKIAHDALEGNRQ